MGENMDLEFQKAVELFTPSLYRLAYSYCGSYADAEDVVQEVFLKYLQKPPSCDSEQKLRAWLMTVTVNKCKDLLRTRRRQNPPEPEPVAAVSNDDKLDIHSALQKLSPTNRIVVYLYYYEELSTQEIAQTLHLTGSAVRSRLYQARKQLKGLLGDEHYG